MQIGIVIRSKIGDEDRLIQISLCKLLGCERPGYGGNRYILASYRSLNSYNGRTMINVCYNCGEYRADKTIDPGGPYAICPVCGYRHPFIQAPLLLVCGASGAGKSTLCQALAGKMDEVVLLDGDILWRPEFARPEDNFRGFFETWLRLGKNISQSGRPVVLFLAGAIPENVEPCVERRYFSRVHYLALACDEEDLAERLRRRPRWRESGNKLFVEEQIRFNRWLTERGRVASPPIELIETSGESVEKGVKKVALWIREKVGFVYP